MQSLQKSPSRQEMIYAILTGEFASHFLLDSLGASIATLGNRPQPPKNSQLQSERQKLEAMADSELVLRHQGHLRWRAAANAKAQATKEAKAKADGIAKEAAQFYNHADAQANLAHWSKAEYWTFDEAIALLLGKSPKVLTPERVRQEVRTIENGFFLGTRPTVPVFLRSYEELYDLARRARVMNTPRMHPAVAVGWAQASGAVVPPEQLVNLLEGHIALKMSAWPSPAPPPAPEKSRSVSASLPASVMRSTKDTRRDLLSPVIEDAQSHCRDPWDLAEVWGQLLVSAEKKKAPLLGSTEKGIQYLKDGEAANLSQRALRERLKRAAEKSR